MDRVLYLRTLEGLQNLSPAELASLADHARERFFRRGETLLEEGETPDCFYVVVEGEVEVSTGGVQLGVRTERQAVGLLSLLSGDEGGVQATARGNVLSLQFDADFVFDALEESFTVIQNLLRNTSRRYLSLFQQVAAGTRVGHWDSEVSCPARPLDLVERIVLLRRAPVFQNTSLDALGELSRQLVEVRQEAREVLWQIGDPSDALLIVVCGSVECQMADGGKMVAGPGFPLGSPEVHAGEPRWYRAVTLEHSVFLKSDSEILMDLMEDHVDMSMAFLGAIAGRVLALNEQVHGAGPG